MLKGIRMLHRNDLVEREVIYKTNFIHISALNETFIPLGLEFSACALIIVDYIRFFQAGRGEVGQRTMGLGHGDQRRVEVTLAKWLRNKRVRGCDTCFVNGNNRELQLSVGWRCG